MRMGATENSEKVKKEEHKHFQYLLFFPLIDLYNQQIKFRMSLAKTKQKPWSVHVKCFRAQELNTRLNNQVMT